MAPGLAMARAGRVVCTTGVKGWLQGGVCWAEMAEAKEATPLTLATPVSKVKGVTARQAEALTAMGLRTVAHLVAHLPLRHEKHEAEAAIADLTPGHIVSTRGEITATRLTRKGPKSRFQAVMLDSTGRIDLVWFNQPYLKDKIQPGLKVRIHGELGTFNGGLQVANPKWEAIRGEDEPPAIDERIRPVYPASEALPTAQIEKIIAGVLGDALPLIEDHLPEAFRNARNLPGLAEAYRMQHAPETFDEANASRRRLAYDELLFLQLGVGMKRAHLRLALKAPKLRHTAAIDRHIRERLGFVLTPYQDEVIAEIVKDLSSTRPTNRLIQGDVGSGKTVVALYAMLLAVADGHQAALMAPTEILAEQHYAGISRTLAGSRVRTALLTGNVTGREREGLLTRLEGGEIDLLIGTHAVLTERVRFKSLAVAIIDEQHRFGVEQRASLRAKASDATSTPHALVMTATPIPRTIAITLFGDLDSSSIRGLPPGRTPVVTRYHAFSNRAFVYREVDERLARGEQAFIVVPAIEPGEVDASGAAIRDVATVLHDLERTHLRGRRLAALHGKLHRDTRDAVMERFRAGQIDALVATTVIEVGVDVPNATVMVVEQADRFGLAQLHQLRGRVGRGSAASVCELIADPVTEEAKQRLRVMETVSDGFVLAEHDLDLRGPGELFGARQSGVAPLKVADLVADRELLAMARRDAMAWIAKSPTLSRPEEATLKRRLLKAHGGDLGLADVG